MSYEKISGIRINAKKNILEFKSHSNNDNAPATYWAVKGDTFEEKVLNAFGYWQEGSIHTYAKKDALGALRYAFVKFSRFVKENVVEPDYCDYAEWKDYVEADKDFTSKRNAFVKANASKLIGLVLEKDTKACYYLKYGDSYVQVVYRYDSFSYGWGSGKLFTRKEAELIQMLNSDCELMLEDAFKL